MTTTTSSISPTDTARSTTDLLAGACDQDPKAWDEIMRRYRGVVFTKVRSFGLQDADTLDAVQMTWLRLAENCHRIQFPEQLGGWLATTACRECLRILRHQTQHAPTSHDTVAHQVADPSVGPEQHAIDADTAQRLWDLVATLPPRRQTLIRELFINNPRPYTEVARNTGIPTGGIGPTRARALTQLRRRLHERGLDRQT
ncbi:MAG: sigma-70 family RNA polymerase sigma factor [Pseudonocardiaceae bacterium]